MTTNISRRSVLSLASAAAVGAALPFGAQPVFAQSNGVRWASLAPGFTVLITQYIRHFELDKANGFSLGAPTEYTSVPTYYGDFDAGNYDVCIGSWDSFAVRYLRGVPIKYLCSITTGEMINFLTTADSGIASAADLAGKTIAAPQSTGTYRMARAVLNEFEGVDIESAATVQNVTNPAASVSVMRAGSADAALTWEPNVSNALAQDSNIQVLYNVGKSYASNVGSKLPYFGVAVRAEVLERDPAIAGKISATFKACIDGILSNTAEAIQVVGEGTGFEPAVLQEAIESGRLSFEFSSMADEAERQVVLDAAEFCVRNELLPGVPDQDYFAQA